jgi:hypothetical protein
MAEAGRVHIAHILVVFDDQYSRLGLLDIVDQHP